MTGGPDALAEWTEFHEQAAALPDVCRVVFEQMFYNGLEATEVARTQGLDPRTVRSRYRRACVLISDALGGRLPGL